MSTSLLWFAGMCLNKSMPGSWQLVMVSSFYTANDESPTGVPNTANGGTKESGRSLTENQSPNEENDGNSMFARLQALKPRLLPIMSRFSNNAVDSQNKEGLNTNALQKINKRKPISPLIMGKNQTRLKITLSVSVGK